MLRTDRRERRLGKGGRRILSFWLLLAAFDAGTAGAAGASGNEERALTEKLGQNFFDQATRSINHDKSVLAKLEAHPLAHASGWQIDETQGPNKVCVHRCYVYPGTNSAFLLQICWLSSHDFFSQAKLHTKHL
jgi:hypothetical protein